MAPLLICDAASRRIPCRALMRLHDALLTAPQARNCYCTPAVWGARVDCTVCRCTGCPRPAVADQEECAADPIKENPYYLSTQGTCEL